jgi:hypothetical protein
MGKGKRRAKTTSPKKSKEDAALRALLEEVDKDVAASKGDSTPGFPITQKTGSIGGMPSKETKPKSSQESTTESQLGSLSPPAPPVRNVGVEVLEVVTNALARLLSYEVQEGMSLLLQLKEVDQLTRELRKYTNAAPIQIINQILEVAQKEGKTEWSAVVLSAVKTCTDTSLDPTALKLTSDEARSALQIYLDSLNRKSLGSYEKNKESVELIRGVADAYHLRLTYQGQFVSVRPAPQKNATIECRLPTEKRQAVFSGTYWPKLKVHQAD